VTMAQLSIVVPAYNEASVIARTLRPLADGARDGRLDVIVVANGCKDDTVAEARRACPSAKVIETAEASKSGALNLGAVQAQAAAVVFLDADLGITEAALWALVAPILTGTADTATCRMDVDTAQSTLLVRAFYRGWQFNPYFDMGKFGGLYALSQATKSQVFPIDPVVADDELVSRRCAGLRRAHVKAACFTVTAPRGMRDLLNIRRRSRRGTAALDTAGVPENKTASLVRFARVCRRVASQPSHWPDVAVYGVVIVWTRLALRLRPAGIQPEWERDLSSRPHSCAR
jgi:glycosyltransferase involved in cell wall biosynthesis